MGMKWAPESHRKFDRNAKNKPTIPDALEYAAREHPASEHAALEQATRKHIYEPFTNLHTQYYTTKTSSNYELIMSNIYTATVNVRKFKNK